jgi:peptidyl-dipeptidase A
MLALGSSKPWPDALEILTGERVLNADAILEYFEPLSQWLEAKNKRLGVNFGWDHSDGEITHIIY